MATGERKWEFKLHVPSHAGLMTTACRLVFGSNETPFFALDAKTSSACFAAMAKGRIG